MKNLRYSHFRCSGAVRSVPAYSLSVVLLSLHALPREDWGLVQFYDQVQLLGLWCSAARPPCSKLRWRWLCTRQCLLSPWRVPFRGWQWLSVCARVQRGSFDKLVWGHWLVCRCCAYKENYPLLWQRTDWQSLGKAVEYKKQITHILFCFPKIITYLCEK